MFAVGIAMPPEHGQAVDAALDDLHETMGPWLAEGGYYNFADRPCDVEAILPEETCSRLGEVKRAWDPDGVIRANHELALTAA
jgi:hypothetical protein